MASDFINDEPTEEQLWEMLPEQVGVAKVSTLIDLTNATASRNDYGYALSIAETGVETAQGERDEQVLAKALVTRAHVYFHLDRYQECAEDYLTAAQLFERYESLLAACRGYYDACRAYYFADLNEIALDFNTRALDLAQQCEDPEALGRCLLQKARLQDEMKADGDEILATLDEARSVLRKAQLTKFVVDCDEHRMTVLCDNDRFEEALEVARGALHVADVMSESKSAYFHYMVGRLLRQNNLTEDGLAYLEKSLEMNKNLEDTPGVASVLAEMGRSFRTLGLYDEALQCATKAKANFDASGLDDAMFNCDMLRFYVLRDAERYDEVFGECKEMLEKNSDALERFVIGLQIAETLLTLKRYQEAADQLQSLEILEAWQGAESCWFTWHRLTAELAAALGDVEQAREIAIRTLSNPGIKVTYPDNRRRLRALLGE